MPCLFKYSLPASNCGLIRITASVFGSSFAMTLSSVRQEMNDTSMQMKLMGRGNQSARSALALRPSMLTQRGSLRSRSCS